MSKKIIVMLSVGALAILIFGFSWKFNKNNINNAKMNIVNNDVVDFFYTNPEGDYTIKIPKGWGLDDKNKNVTIKRKTYLTGSSTVFEPKLILQADSTIHNLEEWLYKNNIILQNSSIVSIESVVRNDYDMERVEYIGKDFNGLAYYYMLPGTKKILQIRAYPYFQNSEDINTFEEMLNDIYFPNFNREVETAAEFDDKIIYRVFPGISIEAYLKDCDKRGGEFNECSSPCPKDEESCEKKCVYACNFSAQESIRDE